MQREKAEVLLVAWMPGSSMELTGSLYLARNGAILVGHYNDIINSTTNQSPVIGFIRGGNFGGVG